MERCEITDMEYSECCDEVPELIDFFKSEAPLLAERHMGKQEHLYRPGSQLQWSVNPAAPPERAIADDSEDSMLVDFFKGGNGDLDLHRHGDDDALLISRSSVDTKQHPMPKLKLGSGEPWSLHIANPLKALKMVASPASTGTEESGTAAPKTPNCDLEMAYGRTCPDQKEHFSAHQGSTFSHSSSKLAGMEVCADSGISHGRERNPLEVEDEETDDVVQAATSLLSLASSEGTRRRRRRPHVSFGDPVESEPGSDEEAGLSSSCVLSRPTNKRRYKLVVDLLAETPSVR